MSPLLLFCAVLDHTEIPRVYERTWQRRLSNRGMPHGEWTLSPQRQTRLWRESIWEFSRGFLAYVIVTRVNLYEDTRNRDDRRTLFPAPSILTNVS